VIVRRRGRGRVRMAGGAVVVEGVLPINGTAATAAAADLRLQLLLLLGEGGAALSAVTD